MFPATSAQPCRYLTTSRQVSQGRHLRTTNRIESTVATERLRQRVTKGSGSPAAGIVLRPTKPARSSTKAGKLLKRRTDIALDPMPPDDETAGLKPANPQLLTIPLATHP